MSATIYAKEVNINELSKNTKNIEFVNYRGPVPNVDPPAEVRSIGVQLAQGLGNKQFARFRYHLKYSVIHADSDQDPDKLAADIFYIDKRAQVGHINYVRLMLRGFLETKYGYSSRDSRTLAVFITYYNAVYRGDMEYFDSQYKQIVTRNITKNNAGISTLYNEWPGRTAMVIPLTDEAQRNNINSLDTSLLTDDKIIEDMRKETDMSIDERKDMVDLEKKQLDEKKSDLDKKKTDQENLDKEIQKKQETIEKKKTDIEKTTDPVEKKQKEEELKKEEKELEKTQEDKKKLDETVKKTEENITKTEDNIKKQEDQIKKDEEEVKKKTDPEFVADKKKELEEKEKELTQKEKELEKKEEEIKKNEDPAVFDGVFYYLKIKKFLDDGIYENELYSINPATRKVLKKSPYEHISGRKYDIFAEGVVIIGFEGQNRLNHKLILLDKQTLQPKVTSKDIVFYRSFIIIKDDYIYAILMEEGSTYLGKYDKNLKRVFKSTEKVEKDSFITFYGDYIYINNDLKNKILVLNKEDLSLIDSIVP